MILPIERAAYALGQRRVTPNGDMITFRDGSLSVTIRPEDRNVVRRGGPLRDAMGVRWEVTPLPDGSREFDAGIFGSLVVPASEIEKVRLVPARFARTVRRTAREDVSPIVDRVLRDVSGGRVTSDDFEELDEIALIEAVYAYCVDAGEYEAITALNRLGFRPRPSLSARTLDEDQRWVYRALEKVSKTAGAKTAAFGDPYWLVAKYPGKTRDGTPFAKGERVLYFPRTKTFFTGKEAETAWRRFQTEAADDDFGMRSASDAVARRLANIEFWTPGDRGTYSIRVPNPEGGNREYRVLPKATTSGTFFLVHASPASFRPQAGVGANGWEGSPDYIESVEKAALAASRHHTLLTTTGTADPKIGARAVLASINRTVVDVMDAGTGEIIMVPRRIVDALRRTLGRYILEETPDTITVAPRRLEHFRRYTRGVGPKMPSQVGDPVDGDDDLRAQIEERARRLRDPRALALYHRWRDRDLRREEENDRLAEDAEIDLVRDAARAAAADYQADNPDADMQGVANDLAESVWFGLQIGNDEFHYLNKRRVISIAADEIAGF